MIEKKRIGLREVRAILPQCTIYDDAIPGFAARLGLPAATVRNWEQGKRLPRGPARALLRMIDKAPESALAALMPD